MNTSETDVWMTDGDNEYPSPQDLKMAIWGENPVSYKKSLYEGTVSGKDLDDFEIANDADTSWLSDDELEYDGEWLEPNF